MLIVKAYKYRLKTNEEVANKLLQFSGSCRYVWNKILALQEERFKSGEKRLSYVDTAKLLTEWKKEEETKWLSNVHSQILQQTLKDLDKAYRDFFRIKDRGKPSFKKRHGKNSFRYPQGIKVIDDKIYLPKIGFVSFYKSREIEGKIKNVIVSKDSNQWYIAVQTEIEIADPVNDNINNIIGIDLGVTDSIAASSKGDMPKAICGIEKYQEKMKNIQRKIARQKKGSKNRGKAKERLGKLYRKISDIRKDYLQKLSTNITKSHGVVVIESLQIKNMTRSAKGTVENPGKNVKAKSGLNRSILEQGWGMFINMLEYKLNYNGGRLIKVGAKYTSQKCSHCGHTEKENRKTRSSFVCKSCGHEEHADINAAKNIKAAGHAVLACGSNHISGRNQESVGTSNLLLPA